MRHIIHLSSVLLLLTASSCNGIFDGIYDEPPVETSAGVGFIERPTPTQVGKIYFDATSYTDWVYLDFNTLTMTTLPVGEEAPAEWDMAVHRYDVKTNGGAVLETGATSVAGLNYTGVGENWIADEWTEETIVTDMSTMMDGYLSYAPDFYNAEMSKWLDVDKSSMPPTYTPSNKVYLLRRADSTVIALRLANYMDASGVKGWMTIEYQFIN